MSTGQTEHMNFNTTATTSMQNINAYIPLSHTMTNMHLATKPYERTKDPRQVIMD